MAKYLEKANNETLSFCQCERGLASIPGQLDCPWCGCGYLIACTYCRKAFTYARVVEIDLSYVEIVTADRKRGGYDTATGVVQSQADWLAHVMKDFEIGDLVVYFDGFFLRAEADNLELDGLFATHSLARLPHHDALIEPAALLATLGNVEYWLSRERPICEIDN
ncbi:hypothetical protein QP162_14740 [Sphingomonas aurantiaca]|uniref:Uncharacterized protein n=1 Tax=Sphingomonas aurantiaca TaxID=185949 RepID=A0A2T5GNM6_9SPHN|nr:hypothetical protein [Sphingomonas aurantiaca]PTQ60913.1 hypothetical protein C8J26_1229 [Sphingomonas aurantiaca]